LAQSLKTENLVDHHDHRRLAAHLGIDHECLHRPIAMLDGDILAVARRLVQRSFRPILRGQ
jgi:hypothetical protein